MSERPAVPARHVDPPIVVAVDGLRGRLSRRRLGGDRCRAARPADTAGHLDRTGADSARGPS